ncbi:MAG: hypothetical protein EXR43_06250 [Dehalococcoidia bacterium]|nr:hypothetical protein [Dehalococcoidia bacterium]
MTESAIRNHAAFIWSVADLLRGNYKQSEYGKLILPLVVLRRFDSVLESTKQAVFTRQGELAARIENVEPVLQNAARQQFYNIPPLDFRRLLDDPANLADNLRAYIGDFSSAARDVIERQAGDDRNYVRKAANWALRQIGKRNAALNAAAIASTERIRAQGTKSARWIAADALRELRSERVRAKLGRGRVRRYVLAIVN